MSKESLIYNLQVIIHKISKDADKTVRNTANFKIKQYNDAIKIIQKYPHDTITDINDIEAFFKENGKKKPTSMLEKIGEFILNGYITQANDALSDPHIKALMELTKIANIGPAKAKELYTKYNIITVEDLQNAVAKNSSIIHAKQHIGLKYHFDLQKRIPRSEIIEYDKLLTQICNSISPELKMSINGSYRRNLPDSGDIDVLITGPKGFNVKFRQLLIKKLIDMGIIKEVLANGIKKFMGISKLSEPHYHRHIDIIDTDIDEYPFAQLYFTGSGGFNSGMRAIALKKGFSINEYCISDKNTKEPVSIDQIMAKLNKPMFENEKDIFKFIDMKYVEPHMRNKTTL